MASGPAWARRARGGARCSAGWCRCLRPACGPLRLLGSSGKGLPGLLPGAPTDRPPRELSGRERGWHARGPLVLPFCAQSTCPRCAQRPWQRLLQQAERPLRGGRAAFSLGLRGPAVADAHARRGWPCGARQPRLAVAGMGHTATLRCGRLLVARSESACSHGAGPMRYSKQCFYLMMNGLIQRKLFKVISTIKTSI